MTDVTSILLLHGDAEAQLLADAEVVIPAMFSEREIRIDRAWMTRPDWLMHDAPLVPTATMSDGVSEMDVRELLAQPYRLIIFSLLPAVAVPALQRRDGRAFLAHRGLSAESAQTQPVAECTELPALTPQAAAAALETVIESLHERGMAVAVCTAFRRVQEPLRHRAEAAASLRENVRRINLEVAELSRRTGCFVLDLDRPLAQIGGAVLHADCFGGGERAAEIALDELAAVVLDAIPDDVMPLEVS